VATNSGFDGRIVLFCRLASRRAAILSENAVELLELALLHLADGVTHDLILILVPPGAHLLLDVASQLGGQIHVQCLRHHGSQDNPHGYLWQSWADSLDRPIAPMPQRPLLPGPWLKVPGEGEGGSPTIRQFVNIVFGLLLHLMSLGTPEIHVGIHVVSRVCKMVGLTR